MKSSVRFRPWLLTPIALLLGCSPTAKDLAKASPVLAGHVTTETGAPLAGAEISLPGSGQRVLTDAEGSYSVAAVGAKLGEEVAVLVVHPDYARLTTRLRVLTMHPALDAALRRHDLDQVVDLPELGEAALVVPLQKGDAGVVLTVPPRSLATPDGAVVTGPVRLKFSYWHPNQPLLSAPAPLLGVVGDDVAGAVGLVTYGMADIELYRGETKLQVVPGMALGLTFAAPANLAANLVAIDPNDAGAPHLWYADEKTGLWSHVGSLADATLVASADGTQVVAKLPHLSAWNLDGITQTNACVRGRVVDSCGAPVANRNLTLWLLSGGQLAQYTIATGGDGTYCGNLGGSAANDLASGRTATFITFVSALHDPNASVCNPTGVAAFSALCTVNRGAYCAGGDAMSNLRSGPAPVDFGAGVARCKTAQVTVPLCGYCPGTTHAEGCLASTAGGVVRTGAMAEGACGAIPDVVMPGCGDTVPQGGDFCSSANARHMGDPCRADFDCCPNDALICADGLCVPNKDG